MWLFNEDGTEATSLRYVRDKEKGFSLNKEEIDVFEINRLTLSTFGLSRAMSKFLEINFPSKGEKNEKTTTQNRV
jgi:hypothetical protein